MPSITDLFYSRYIAKLPVPTTSFKDQIVIVTGGNSGLGYEAVTYYAKLKAAKVIIACRSLKKGEDAKAAIEKATSCASNVIEVWSLNLSSYDSVKEFAAKVEKDLPRLDVLLCNAGKGTLTFTTEEDSESTITVNVISTFLLSLALLPKLKETASNHGTRSTLTIVTSELHIDAAFKERKAAEAAGISWFDALADQKSSKMMDRYNVSKLLEVFVVQKLAELTGSNSPVTINCVTPGFCDSELRREFTGILGGILWVIEKLFCKTAEEGSRSLVAATCWGPESHGQYIHNVQIRKTEGLTQAKDANAIRDRVWNELSEKLGKIQPGLRAQL